MLKCQWITARPDHFLSGEYDSLRPKRMVLRKDCAYTRDVPWAAVRRNRASKRQQEESAGSAFLNNNSIYYIDRKVNIKSSKSNQFLQFDTKVLTAAKQGDRIKYLQALYGLTMCVSDLNNSMLKSVLK